ncbi:DUF5336 domain-containing protein [Amycolatopsis anabasis]|uniref:DUF5336 domain-containing protein n=1 Tax=Amycolatopsis anabasis TaxID=1840409 RepID=UPI00131B523E|nr:DUF5336 domain-containing protein [Amycolatopsis anabasis]
MTFPSGGPGYPQQGGGAQPNPQAPNTGGFPQQQPPQQQQSAPVTGVGTLSIATLLALAVTVLGLVNYFIGYSDEAAPADDVLRFLLIGGLLSALHVLPKGPRVLPFAALINVLAALTAILVVVRVPKEGEVPGIVTVILILGILQMLVSVAALLFEYGVLTLPAAKPQPAYGGGQYGQQQAPFGQQPQQPSQFGQPQQGPNEQSTPFSQPTKYGPPVSSPGSQSTTYAPQQGQFYQQPSTESGQQQQQPGTPPGGFGQQS